MRILVADNRSNVRFALRALLRQQPELEVVGEAIDVEDLLARVEATRPDVILLDWKLRGSTAVELLPTLKKMYPGLCVIVLSGRPEVRKVALMVGANAFVSKVDPPERLLAAILSVRQVKMEEQTASRRDSSLSRGLPCLM